MMAAKIKAGFDDADAFAFKEFFLERGVWLAD
jgi:hypothetical protein